MPANARLKVVLYWHMHQPEYRDLRTGNYQLPWTYLHIIKDYVDMAAHIRAVPGARAVVNFAPILLEQIADYGQQLTNYLENGNPVSDPLLAALAEPVLPVAVDEKLGLIRDCLRANEKNLIQRFSGYQRAAELAQYLVQHKETIQYLSEQLLADLLVWYHIAWLGETVKHHDPRIKKLIDKDSGFSYHDRHELVGVISENCNSVIDQYRSLAESGQIELSLTPYAHPIMPLMLDINSAREAMPDAVLPALSAYPGGEERVRWHLQHGIQCFEKHFGIKPQGCWPSEGSVSEATLRLLSEAGFRWAASGETVLRNSLNASGATIDNADMNPVHRPYRMDDTHINCFFRDDGLSDLIGFTYADWHADDAVANMVSHLETIQQQSNGDPDTVVSIILDGENAWEYYPKNGYYFLNSLYQTLAEHPGLELTTFSDCLSSGVMAKPLSRLIAGSWVYGTFSTWIGDADKNRGWDMLGEAKRCYDKVLDSGKLTSAQHAAAEKQLAICEGSDWFWWFGDYNPAESVSSFEHLFRLHLSNLYLLLGEEPPDHLSEIFTHGSHAPVADGVMRPGQEPD